MTLRTLLSGLAVMGFVACAGAQTENENTVVYTMADVEAAPEAWRAVDPDNLVVMETSKGQIGRPTAGATYQQYSELNST